MLYNTDKFIIIFPESGSTAERNPMRRRVLFCFPGIFPDRMFSGMRPGEERVANLQQKHRIAAAVGVIGLVFLAGGIFQLLR